MKAGQNNGGHDPATHSGDRPLILTDQGLGVDASGLIPLAGATVKLLMPEVSGDVLINITGTDRTPSQGALKADPLIFEVKVKDLSPIAPIGVAAPGLNFIVDSHPGSINGNSFGGYATAEFGQDVLQTVNAFQAEVLLQTKVPARVIQSKGASLYWGGLFDIDDAWHAPHCGHRDGKAMDISWKSLKPRERIILGNLVKFSKNVKFYSKEAPGTKSDHWHLMLK